MGSSILKLSVRLLFFILLFAAGPAVAQGWKMDSLSLVLKKRSLKDTSRVNVLNELAYQNLTVKLRDQRILSTKALDLSRRIKYKFGEAEACRIIGIGMMIDEDDPFAIERFQKALRLFKELGNTKKVIDTRLNIAAFFVARNDSIQAMEYLAQIITDSRNLHYAVGECRALHDIGMLELTNHRYKEAANTLNKSLNMALDLSDKGLILLDNEEMGTLMQDLKDPAKALSYYRNAMLIGKQQNNIRRQITTAFKMGDVYSQLKQFDQAGVYYRNSIVLSKPYGSNQLLALSFHRMASLDSLKGDFKSALNQYVFYVKVKDSLMAVDRVIETAKLESQYEEERRNRENQNLIVQQRISHRIIQQQYVGLFLLIISVVTLTIISLKLKRVNKENTLAMEALTQKNIEINHQNEIIEKQRVDQEKINRVKDKLFSVISHDMRAPLTQLKGILNLMEFDAVDPDEWDDLLPELKKSVQHSTEQLDNLLLWSKNQMQGFSPKFIYFFVFGLAEKSIAMVEAQILQKNIKLSNNIDPELNIYADKEMIQIVIRNLVSNAIKFTQSGGSVELNSTIYGDEAIISVTDSGIGIKEENISRIFDEIDFSTRGTANEKGTGLGLKLAKDFVHMNKGKIWAEKNATGGSIFKFSVPLTSERTEQISQSA